MCWVVCLLLCYGGGGGGGSGGEGELKMEEQKGSESEALEGVNLAYKQGEVLSSSQLSPPRLQ